mgnify:FL=1
MDNTEAFKKRYQAVVKESPLRVAKIKEYDYNYNWVDHLSLDDKLEFEYEQMVAVHLPQNRLRELVELEERFHKRLNESCSLGGTASAIVRQAEQEHHIRNNNPAVKAAYEKYLHLLSLVESDYADVT